MAADDAARSSRRMDLNLYLGLPRALRPRLFNLGADLALSSSTFTSSPSSSADATPPNPEPLHQTHAPTRADLMRPSPEHNNSLASEVHPAYLPDADVIPELAHDVEFGVSRLPRTLQPRPLPRWIDRPSSSTASSSFRSDRSEHYDRTVSLIGRQSRYLRPRSRRFRSDLPPLSSEAPNLENDTATQPMPEPLHVTVDESKVVTDGGVVGASEEIPERGKSTAMFECNICFEMAHEPVVTSCGHLFCWPCLYQWLHVHSTHKECPVCKGQVTDGNITPIYGRGNSSSDTEKNVVDEGGNMSGQKIPARPHGNRLESFRQQFHHVRPISRRLGDAHEILSSWRRILDQQIMNSVGTFEGPPESITQEMTDHAHRASRLGQITTRMRARRLQRLAEGPAFVDSSVPSSGPPGNNTPDPPRHSSSPLFSERNNLLQCLTLVGLEDREVFATGMNHVARPGQYIASTSSNRPNDDPQDAGINVTAADQTSNSSTMAVIQEDTAFTESAAGSLRSLRRRGRSSALGSLDVDGGDLNRNKRRRLN